MKTVFKILIALLILIVAYLTAHPFYSYFSGNGPSTELDFMRNEKTVTTDRLKSHEKICEELKAKPELRGGTDITGMPTADGVCVTLTKISYLK